MSDMEEQEDTRTMRELCKMGNSVSAMIQLEGDTPSENSDNKLPILDMKVWVKMIEEEGTQKAKLFYQYYRKPMSNCLYVLLYCTSNFIAIASLHSYMYMFCFIALVYLYVLLHCTIG